MFTENPLESALHFDLATVSPVEILRTIRQCGRGAVVSVRIVGANGQDYIGAGLRDIDEVVVKGEMGDFGFCSFGDGQGQVEGNVGNFFGHSIASGILVVRGHAKHSVGAMGTNGLIAIFGNAGDRVCFHAAAFESRGGRSDCRRCAGNGRATVRRTPRPLLPPSAVRGM